MGNPGKRRVAVLFGGRSVEHEVSLLSARFVVEALDRERYEPVLVGIDKDGRWHLEDEARVLSTSRDPRLARLNAAAPDVALAVHPTSGAASLVVQDQGALGLVERITRGASRSSHFDDASAFIFASPRNRMRAPIRMRP